MRVNAARTKSDSADAITLIRAHLDHSTSHSTLIELLGLQLNGLDENVASSLD